MEFNTDKCHVMTIGNKNGKCTSYTLRKQQMSLFESERDLGVIVQSNLKREEHIGKFVRKANQILGLISRAYVNKTQQNIMPLYKSLVRPHLQYAVQAWRSSTQKDIDNIERVQRRATRMIEGLT